MNIFKLCFVLVLLLVANEGLSNSDIDLKKEINSIFEKNGTKAWCVQKDYLDCVDLTNEKCDKQQLPLIPMCLKYANEMVPYVVDESGSGEFSAKFMECMFNEHVFEHFEGDKEIFQCISKAKIETSLLLKHVYEVEKLKHNQSQQLKTKTKSSLN